MTYQPLIVVNILSQIVASVDTALFPTLGRHIRYEHGRDIQIMNKIQRLRSASSTKDTVYPLFAVFQDFPEQTGQGYELVVKFPKIAILTSTVENSDTDDRYPLTFVPILYPIWVEFLNQLAKHPNVVGNDPRAFTSVIWERPGSKPMGTMNDWVDTLEFQNLQLTFQRTQKCS